MFSVVRQGSGHSRIRKLCTSVSLPTYSRCWVYPRFHELKGWIPTHELVRYMEYGRTVAFGFHPDYGPWSALRKINIIVKTQNLKVYKNISSLGQLKVKLEIVAMGKTSLTVYHSLSDPHDELLAIGSTLVVNVNNTKKSEPIPDEERKLIEPILTGPYITFSEPIPFSNCIANRLASQKWKIIQTHTVYYTVQFSDLDGFGHVNHSIYYQYAENAKWASTFPKGFEDNELRHCALLPVKELTSVYHRELLLGNQLKVTVYPLFGNDLEKKVNISEHELSNHCIGFGIEIALCESGYVCWLGNMIVK